MKNIEKYPNTKDALDAHNKLNSRRMSRKWTAGSAFRSMADFSRYIGSHSIVYDTRAKRGVHFGWVVSQQYWYIYTQIFKGVYVKAKKMKKEVK